MKKNSRQSGFSLIEVVMAAGIMGIIASVTASLFISMSRSQKKLSITNNLTLLQYNFVNTLQGAGAWENTYDSADNGDLTCVKNSTDCRTIFDTIGSGNGVLVRLKDASGGDIFSTYNSKNATHGFDFDGQPCTTYNSAAGNDACPIRVEILWKPLCPALPATCTEPKSQLMINYSYKPKNTTHIINIARFNSTLVQGVADVNIIAAACTAIGGTYDAVTGICNQATINQNVGQSCTVAGTFMVGFNADGSLNCQALPP